MTCPFCADGHKLWLHGWYTRQVILPAGDGCRRIPVRRLRCERAGRTVSLLPDFCVPKRQHGAAVLGAFLLGHLVKRLPLVKALRRARGEAPSHSVAQALRDAFRCRCGRIRDYLAASASAEATPLGVVLAMQRGFGSIAEAFRDHGRAFHAASSLGLA